METEIETERWTCGIVAKNGSNRRCNRQEQLETHICCQPLTPEKRQKVKKSDESSGTELKIGTSEKLTRVTQQCK